MRFTLANEHDDDRRLFTTLWPHHAGELVAGETVLVIAPPTNPGRALVADLYA
jgi:hypothetical protein